MADTFEAGADPDATAKLGGGARRRCRRRQSGGYLGVKLTQTGAVLGNARLHGRPSSSPGAAATRAPNQFSFCVALYEGLHRKRPFAGNNVIEIMANVVGGTISEPPDGRARAGWIRKVLLRGLRVAPGERHESMTALLAALARDPAVRRRRWFTAAAAAAGGGDGSARTGSAPAARAVRGRPGRAASAWGPDRRAAIERASPPPATNAAPGVLRRRRTVRRLRRQLDRHVQGGVRGDARAWRAIGRRPRPAHGLPRRASVRGARRDGRARDRRRRCRRQCGGRREQPADARSLQRRRDVARRHPALRTIPRTRARVEALARRRWPR